MIVDYISKIRSGNLDLSDSNLTDDDLLPVIDFLTVNHLDSYLNLSNNHLTEISIDRICNMLMQNPNFAKNPTINHRMNLGGINLNTKSISKLIVTLRNTGRYLHVVWFDVGNLSQDQLLEIYRSTTIIHDINKSSIFLNMLSYSDKYQIIDGQIRPKMKFESKDLGT